MKKVSSSKRIKAHNNKIATERDAFNKSIPDWALRKLVK